MNKATNRFRGRPLLIATAVAVFSALPAISTSPARAAGAELSGFWPQWRGPTRDDLSKDSGLLTEWPKDGPPLAWEAKGLGGGFSGVAVVDGKIFTMGDDDNGIESVIALGAADGRMIWSRAIGKSGHQDKDKAGSRATPAVDGEFVYAMDPTGDVACFKTADGDEVWHVHRETDLGGAHPKAWLYADSPMIDGDHLICAPGGKEGTLAALDKKTGKVVWRSEGVTDDAAYSSPVAADIGGKHQIIELTFKSVFAVAADTGKLLWRIDRKGTVAVIPTPIVDGNFVYVASGYGNGCDLFKIDTSTSQFTAERVYANKVMVNHHGGVILYKDHLYGYSDGGGWTCQELASGKAIWQEKNALGKGSIAYADGHFYLRGEGGPGTVVLIEATPDGFKESGRFDPPDRSKLNAWPHPVITGGKMYIRDQNVLLCYDVAAK